VGDLEDDDLELLQENTGADFSHRLTRLRRAGGSVSPPPASSSKRKVVVVSSDDDDLDNDVDSTTQDIANLWDDERGVGAREEDDEMDLDDMDNFIEYEDEDGTGVMNEAEREEKRRERRRMEKERRKALGNRPELAGIDATYVFSCMCNGSS
jgi:transcription elongation factor SPT6